jgi:tetratricopeptide (TPR) repeat protein
MYLRGSKFDMNRRRKPFNYFKIIGLVTAIGFVMYFGVVIGPQVQSSIGPTPTATRDPESYVTEAGQLFEQGKLPQAIQAYQQAIAARPNDASIYISLARMQVWAGLYPEAQTSAENALLLNPNNSTAYAVRGWALEFQGNFLEGEAAIKRALELDDKNALAHAYYAELLTDQYLSGTGPLDVVDKATEESLVALALAPGMLESHRASGYINEMVGNKEKAILEYQAALAINKNLAILHLALGRVYRAMGVYDKAVESFTRANTLNPSDPVPLYLISRVYATIGEYKKAIQFAQQAIKIRPSDTNQRGNLGVMYYRENKWPEAATELALVINGGKDKDGVEIKPIELSANVSRSTEYYFTYGLVLVKLDRCGEALPLFQKLLSTVPGDEVAVYNANEGNRLCSIAAGTPQPTETGTPGTETPAGSAKRTPAKTPAVITPTP